MRIFAHYVSMSERQEGPRIHKTRKRTSLEDNQTVKGKTVSISQKTLDEIALTKSEYNLIVAGKIAKYMEYTRICMIKLNTLNFIRECSNFE